MFKNTMIFMLLSAFVTPAFAEVTQKGKIVSTEGHANPNCRIVQHRENGTGTVRYFRIADIAGDDDVSAVVLAALMANRDITITYGAQTTGCGSEPSINYVTVY